MAQTADTVQLKPDTLNAYQEYVNEAEAAMDVTLHRDGLFLWSDAVEDRARQLAAGQTLAQRWSGERPLKVADGLIHDWVGATRLPHATVEQTLATIQNYDDHKNIYRPEVIDSKLISRSGDDFQIYLRLLKKKIITVVLDTDHEVHYYALDATRWACRSYSTRISEVEHAGTPAQRVLPPDTGYGFLWRLYSYWRFRQSKTGVDVECRAISLTRDVPAALRWIIEPIVGKLPRKSLIHVLHATRQAVARPQ